MKTAFAILFCLSVVTAMRGVFVQSNDEYYNDYTWNMWMRKHGRQYSSSHEYNMRKTIFVSNLEYINNHNKEHSLGLHNFTLGMNQFGDMTHHEWSGKFMGYSARNRNTIHLHRSNPTSSNPESIPSSIDWRKKGAVTPVKNQGQCGSCWSFSATGSMEGAVYISTGKLVSLSEQQLCDCSRPEGDQGCFGGLMDDAFEYVVKNGGLDTEKDYPYKAKDGSCNSSKQKKHAATISSYKDVATNDENALAAAVAQQPVSVAIEADQPAFQFYRSGVFDTSCGTKLDHGVLAVGYGEDNGMKYWIVKNSWGETWGDGGYILMARDTSSSHGQCGIAMQPSYPVV